jgi:isoleucyl-tRNA synthetase
MNPIALAAAVGAGRNSLLVKPNFRVLGKKVGKQMREAQEKIARIDRRQIHTLLNGSETTIDLGGEPPFVLTPEDVQIEFISDDLDCS